jgi:hypothetical protein
MPENPHFDDFVVNPETHHEESDVDVRGILWFAVIFFAFAVVTHILLYFLFGFYRSLFRGEVQPPRTAITAPAQLPQTPRLQPFPAKDQRGEPISPVASTPVVDMVEMRSAEDEALRNPGWIDRQKGVVRLPIERAKQLALQRGIYKVNMSPIPNVVPPQAGEPNAARVGGQP